LPLKSSSVCSLAYPAGQGSKSIRRSMAPNKRSVRCRLVNLLREQAEEIALRKNVEISPDPDLVPHLIIEWAR
jgi:hypothetical protein